MAILNVKCQVSKETYELFLGVAGFVGEMRRVMSDGFDPAVDSAFLMAAAAKHLVPAMAGVNAIADEANTNRAAFVNAILIGGTEIWKKAQPSK